MADSRELVLCDVLCFIVNKFVRTGIKQLKGILIDFYSAEVLNEAKVRLLNDIEALNTSVRPPHVSRHRDGDNRITREADDLITLLQFLDENKLLSSLPKYVSASPDSMPSVRLLDGDLNVLIVMLEKMNGKFEEYRSTLAAIVHDVGVLQSKFNALDQFPVLQASASAPAWVQPRQSQPAPQVQPQPRHSHESLRGNPTHTSSNPTTAIINSEITTASQSADTAHLFDDRVSTRNWATIMSTPNRYAALSTDDEQVNGREEPFTTVNSRRVKRQRTSPPAAAINARAQSTAAAQRQDQRQPRTFVFGKSSAVGAKVVAARKISRKAIFCLDNLSKNCSVDDITLFVSSLSVEVLSCFEVKSRRRRGEGEYDVDDRKAFRLAINADQRDRLLNESAWPDSVLISDWYFKPRADRPVEDKRRRVDDQSNLQAPLQASSRTTSTAEGVVTRSANTGSVVAEIHVDNEDTIVVSNMDAESDAEFDDDDGDGERGQHGSTLNQ